MKTVKKEKRNQNLRDYHKKYPDMTYADLGRVFKLSRERIRQLLQEKK
jgi:DNA-directed RNA polymerase sigma subunit (sigma70/sigma32)|tara:strand:- start:1448 stop:1591 length:144 start_codon:yes stop_codon:yes gene_type:complete